MKRTQRASMARETVAICEAGGYVAPDGTRVQIVAALAQAKKDTELFSPENPPRHQFAPRGKTRCETRNETTFSALARLAAAGNDHLACLNFASAKNPGGGFLNGSLAQEEALACASALYPCLLAAPEYYERNRSHHSALYLDQVIFSPRVPFFRDDEGILLARPFHSSVITAPAPNAGAVLQNEPENTCLIESVLRRRAELVLAVAATRAVDRLVLGAWGCGVFRNDPRMVAAVFAELLGTNGKFAGVFNEVNFAVYDRSGTRQTCEAFAEQFPEGKT